MANTLAKSTAVRFMEDEQNSSAASTPVMTPQPDLRDKRLPSINHSYFGQVRPRSASSTPSASVHPLVAPAPARSVASSQPLHAKEHMVGSDGPLTAPSSPDVQPFEEGEPPALLPHERLGDSQQRLLPDHEDIDSYPTPPISSSSSMHKEQAPHSDLIERTSTSSDPVQASGSAAEDKSPATLSTPLRPRRHTFALLNPLSSIVTSSNVHAAHISNPSTDHSTASTPPADPASSASGTVPATLSYSELRKLTSGVSLAPLKKTTPPQTPRALSHEANSGDQQRSSQGSNNDVPGVQQTSGPDKDIENHGPGTESSPAPNAAAAVGPPKGKLIVRITEGRGLRPSHDPYVVCVFEWNEYISKGPKHEHVGAVDQNGHKKPEASGAVPIRRSTSDMGRPMAIPMKSRQSSNTSLTDSRDGRDAEEVTDPKWDLEAVFDVVGMHSEIDVSVYDRWNQEAFLGHVRFCPNLHDDTAALDSWFKLEPRTAESEQVTGEIHLQMRFQKTDKKHYGPEDFQILKLIGKGTFGQVYQVRKKDTQRIYAMKVLSKKVIVQKKEVAHTLGERNILVRTAMADSPFIVGLKFSFQTPTDLYLVTDYMSGGELFWHLQKEGRFNEQRAKFYIAELILALQHLHEHDIVYRDLKPENILLDANGHIALCDFGLSKANLTKNDTTNTFCGTTEYLAPEVLLDEQGYTKMVDFWSLGVLVFEMCCGWSPFYAEDTQQMYKNIAFGKVRFPRDALSTEGRNFVKGLLNRNPKHRLGANHDAEELKAHPFFADVDWDALTKKNVVPPFKPKLKSETDTSNFDPEFTNALNGASSLNARAAALAAGTAAASTPLSPGMQANFQGFTFVDESSIDDHFPSQSSDRMDEDEKIDDDWEMSSAARDHRGDRMSGVMKTGGGEEGVFNHGNFDI